MLVKSTAGAEAVEVRERRSISSTNHSWTTRPLHWSSKASPFSASKLKTCTASSIIRWDQYRSRPRRPSNLAGVRLISDGEREVIFGFGSLRSGLGSYSTPYYTNNNNLNILLKKINKSKHNFRFIQLQQNLISCIKNKNFSACTISFKKEVEMIKKNYLTTNPNKHVLCVGLIPHRL